MLTRSGRLNGLGMAMVFGAVLGGMPATTHAGGFLADTFIRPFSPELADRADEVNEDLGRPVDHALAEAADDVVPGAGTAWEEFDEGKREGWIPSIQLAR